MTLWRTSVEPRDPARVPYRDFVPVKGTAKGYKPAGGKGGAAAAFQQPIEYSLRYAYERYGGEQKVRALAWYYQKEYKEKYKRWAAYDYGISNAKALYEKKVPSNAGTNSKFQASTFGYSNIRRRQREQRVRNQRWYVAGKRRYKSHYSIRKQALFRRYQRKFYKQQYYNRN